MSALITGSVSVNPKVKKNKTSLPCFDSNQICPPIISTRPLVMDRPAPVSCSSPEASSSASLEVFKRIFCISGVISIPVSSRENCSQCVIGWVRLAGFMPTFFVFFEPVDGSSSTTRESLPSAVNFIALLKRFRSTRLILLASPFTFLGTPSFSS